MESTKVRSSGLKKQKHSRTRFSLHNNLLRSLHLNTMDSGVITVSFPSDMEMFKKQLQQELMEFISKVNKVTQKNVTATVTFSSNTFSVTEDVVMINRTPSSSVEGLPTGSWQEYVDKQLLASKCVTKACIAGLDGNVWAKSDGFEVAKHEITKLVAGFDNQDVLTAGVTLAGQRYNFLSGTDRVVQAKLGTGSVYCMKTQQAVVVSLYEDPTQPQQAASVVEKLGHYLVSCGY